MPPALCWGLVRGKEISRGLENQPTAPWKHLRPSQRDIIPEGTGLTWDKCLEICDYRARQDERRRPGQGEKIWGNTLSRKVHPLHEALSKRPLRAQVSIEG